MLHYMANSLITSGGIQKAPWKLAGISCMQVKDFYGFFMPTFSGEENLKLESERKCLDPIFNLAMKMVDRRNCYRGMVRFTSMEDLLIKYLETESNVKNNKACTEINACLRWLAVSSRTEAGTGIFGKVLIAKHRQWIYDQWLRLPSAYCTQRLRAYHEG